MDFNITWDSSVAAAPAAFKTDVQAVANYFSSVFTDPVTVNIAVGFGEVNGQTLGAGALGESMTYFGAVPYSLLSSSLKLDALTANDFSSSSHLASSTSGHWFVTTAQGKALGIYSGAGPDGYVGFSSGAHFDYNASDGVSTGSYDFFSVVAHEFSEVMGRQLLAGENFAGYSKSYTALDLFHFASTGVRDLVGTLAGYFSVNNGVTHLQAFNTNPNGDFGDWATSVKGDAFDAFSSSGIVNKINAGDLAALDVIGWDQTSAGTASSASYPISTAVHLALSNLTHAIGASLASVGQGFQSSTLISDFDSYYGA